MDGAEKGQREAHTGAEISGAAGCAGGGAGGGAADAREFARLIEAEAAAAEGVQVDLFDASPLPEVLPIGGARSRIEAARARGRPAGSGNKRTEIMRDYLLRRGFTHPMEGLASVGSASVDEVAVELAGGQLRYDNLDQDGRVAVRDKALAHIINANRALLPYFESKRPVEVHVDETTRHLLVGDLGGGAKVVDGSAMSLAGGENPFDDQ